MYWKVNTKPESKISVRAVSGVLVGYSQTGYQLWIPEMGKMLESRDVRINEKLVYGNIFRKNITLLWPLVTEILDDSYEQSKTEE